MMNMLKLATGTILSGFLMTAAYAGEPEVIGQKATDRSAQTGTSVQPLPGSSVVERDKKRYDNQKRAAARKAAELKKADSAKKPAKAGSSVVERDKKRYATKKRAADQRAAEMKKTDAAGTTVMEQGTVDAPGKPPAQ